MKLRFWIQGAVIAAVYAVVTVVAAPISYGIMQVRVSESMTVLPALTSAGLPGIFVGCIVANLLGPYGIIDVICGSLASLLGAYGTYKLKDRPFLMLLPPVIANGIIIGAMLHYAYGVKLNLFLCMSWVAAGEFLACYIIGLPLFYLLRKYEGIFK